MDVGGAKAAAKLHMVGMRMVRMRMVGICIWGPPPTGLMNEKAWAWWAYAYGALLPPG